MMESVRRRSIRAFARRPLPLLLPPSLLLSVACLSLAGCGGGGARPSPTPAPPPAPTPAPTPTPTPAPTPTPTPPPTGNFNTAETRRSDGVNFHGAITAYQAGATGQGILAGVIDDGIDEDSPEFAGRISPASADVAGQVEQLRRRRIKRVVEIEDPIVDMVDRHGHDDRPHKGRPPRRQGGCFTLRQWLWA